MVIELTKKGSKTYEVLIVENSGKVSRLPLLLERVGQNIMVYYSKYTCMMKLKDERWLINGRPLTDSKLVLRNCLVWVVTVLGLPYKIVKAHTIYDARKARWDCVPRDHSIYEWIVTLNYPFRRGRTFIVSLDSEIAIEITKQKGVLW